jgi:Tfp pilus assembly protein PilN
VVGLTARLADLVPDEITLDEVVLSVSDAKGGHALRVSGRSPSEVLVMRLLGALEASPAFDRAALEESKPGAGESREFVLVVTAPAGAEAEEP